MRERIEALEWWSLLSITTRAKLVRELGDKHRSNYYTIKGSEIQRIHTKFKRL